MWLTLLVPFLTKIFGSDGVVGKYIATKQEIEQKKQDAQLARETAQLELIKQQGIDAVESEKNKLQATSQGFKFVTFVLINIPVIVIVAFPSRGKEIFENFALIPVWYAQLYAAIYGIIWGIPVAASAMSSIFTAIQQAWQQRQDKKIEKIQVLGEAQQIGKDAAKKEIFDTMKKAVNLNGYTQAQVDLLNPVLDKILSAQIQPGSTTTINNQP